MRKYFIVILFLIFSFLCACNPMSAVLTTTSAGAVVAESDRTVGEAVDDVGIKIKIAEKYAKSKSGIFLDIDTSVRVGTVLLTGIVETQEIRIEAVRLVWEIEDVKEVLNEIEVGNKQNIKQYTQDLWISSQVKGKILGEIGLDAITYNIETINGKVHILGVANNIEDSTKIINIIKTIKGVKEIANHIITRN